MSRRLIAVGLGVLVAGAVLFLLWPLGCWVAESIPGIEQRARGGCPKNLSHSGLEWPNIWTGLVAAPVLAMLAGVYSGVYAWRRFRVVP